MEDIFKGIVILNGDGLVVNKLGCFGVNETIDYSSKSDLLPDITLEQSILSGYDDTHTHMEYSTDNTITNNQPEMGYKYNQSLNAFIPPRQNDTYILNTETFQWEPDPNLEYDLYADGTKYKWQSGWVKISN